MNWIRVEQLLAECVKLPATDHSSRLVNVGDYDVVLAKYSGIEGFVGARQYLVLWSAEQIVELNAAYQVSVYVPDVVLIGTDGADTAFGIDSQSKRFVSLPLVGMSREQLRTLGQTFEEFLERLAEL